MSEFDRLWRGARDPREFLAKGLEASEHSEQGWLRDGLHDQPGSLFSKNGCTSGQFQVARNPQRLVAAVPEQPDVAFDNHGVLRFIGICRTYAIAGGA
jgi:hypothetical protein